MAREYEGYRDVLAALNETFNKNAINQKELAAYLSCHEKTAKKIIDIHKIPKNCGFMDIHLVARALAKGN